MKAPNTSIPPLYRYNISKLPLDVFVNLTSHPTGIITDTTTTTMNDDAQKLQYDIAYKLKHASVSGIRNAKPTPAPALNTIADDSTNSSNYNYRITTVAKLLQLSPYGIFHRLDPILTLKECIRLYQRICIHCAPHHTTAYSLMSSTSSSKDAMTEIQPLPSLPRDRCRYISTGWDTLDQRLQGGLRIGTITELMGCAGTGKTQLALQTTIATALTKSHCPHSENVPGRPGSSVRFYNGGDGGTIWIDTEQKLSLVRLQEMTIARCRVNHPDIYTVLENVTIHSPSNMHEFLQVLDALENEIIERNTAAADCNSGNTTRTNSTTSDHLVRKKLPVRLIVIDSIAAVVGRESTKTTTAPQQAIGMMQIAQVLKRYADYYSIAILIINQVTSTNTVHSSATSHHVTNNYYPKQHQRAALGTAWHHCITTRIELQQYDALDYDNQHRDHDGTISKYNHLHDSTTKHQSPHRHAKIEKSLTVEPSSTPLPFQITRYGIVDCAL